MEEYLLLFLRQAGGTAEHSSTTSEIVTKLLPKASESTYTIHPVKSYRQSQLLEHVQDQYTILAEAGQLSTAPKVFVKDFRAENRRLRLQVEVMATRHARFSQVCIRALDVTNPNLAKTGHSAVVRRMDPPNAWVKVQPDDRTIVDINSLKPSILSCCSISSKH